MNLEREQWKNERSEIKTTLAIEKRKEVTGEIFLNRWKRRHLWCDARQTFLIRLNIALLSLTTYFSVEWLTFLFNFICIAYQHFFFFFNLYMCSFSVLIYLYILSICLRIKIVAYLGFLSMLYLSFRAWVPYHNYREWYWAQMKAFYEKSFVIEVCEKKLAFLMAQ
jgi:hypothetical protein